MGNIYYIMGKSASGKDRMYSLLLKRQDLNLKKLILYTTRPVRFGETDGENYHFVSEEILRDFEERGRLIEARSYETIQGIWTYFTADDGQVDLSESDYLGIGTLESFIKMKEYYGEDKVIPIYIQVEDGVRLQRALGREREQKRPGYEEMCRRFLADQKDFSEEKIEAAGICRRFENDTLEDCAEEIINYIKSMS